MENNKYYLIEEVDNGVVRYTICATEKKKDELLDSSTFTHVSGFFPMTKEKIREFLSCAGVPIKK